MDRGAGRAAQPGEALAAAVQAAGLASNAELAIVRVADHGHRGAGRGARSGPARPWSPPSWKARGSPPSSSRSRASFPPRTRLRSCARRPTAWARPRSSSSRPAPRGRSSCTEARRSTRPPARPRSLAAGQVAAALEPVRAPKDADPIELAGDAFAAASDEVELAEHVVRLALAATGAARCVLWRLEADAAPTLLAAGGGTDTVGEPHRRAPARRAARRRARARPRRSRRGRRARAARRPRRRRAAPHPPRRGRRAGAGTLRDDRRGAERGDRAAVPLAHARHGRRADLRAVGERPRRHLPPHGRGTRGRRVAGARRPARRDHRAAARAGARAAAHPRLPRRRPTSAATRASPGSSASSRTAASAARSSSRSSPGTRSSACSPSTSPRPARTRPGRRRCRSRCRRSSPSPCRTRSSTRT